MMRTIAKSRRPGFTLLEMLLVILGNGVLVLVGSVLLLSMFKAQRGTALGVQSLEMQGSFADHFRGDVASATAAPDRLAGEQASLTCLILKKADGAQVVYRWENGTLRRTEQAGARAIGMASPVEIHCHTVQFARTGTGGRIIVLRFFTSSGLGPSTELHEVAAALGGDLR